MSCSNFHKQAYFYALHASSLIEVLLMAFVIYCVVSHSHRSQKNFKWLLVSQLTAILIFQLFTSDGTMPVFYLPAAGVAFNGPVNEFLSPPVQTIILFGMAGALMALSVALFEFRHAVVAPRNSRFNWSVRTRKFIFLIRFALAASCGVPFWAFASDQAEAVAEWVQKVPCVLTGIDEHSRTMLYTASDSYSCVLGFISVVIPIFIELVFYVYHSFSLLREKNSTHLSERTRKLQKEFLRVLLFQEIAPLVICYPPPFAYWFMSHFGGFMDLDLNNISLLILLSHGIFAGTAVLVANKPYWTFVLSLLVRCRLLRPNVVQLPKRSLSIERVTTFVRGKASYRVVQAAYF